MSYRAEIRENGRLLCSLRRCDDLDQINVFIAEFWPFDLGYHLSFIEKFEYTLVISKTAPGKRWQVLTRARTASYDRLNDLKSRAMEIKNGRMEPRAFSIDEVIKLRNTLEEIRQDAI